MIWEQRTDADDDPVVRHQRALLPLKKKGKMMITRYALAIVLLFAALTLDAQQSGSSSGTPTTPTPAFRPVTSERLLNADQEPQNWLMYSGNYKAQRFSGLGQIDKGNAHQLQMQWAYQLEALDRSESTPLVIDGVMYVTEAPSNVIALDAKTGRPYWKYEHDLPENLNFCCGRNNRGVAVLGDRLYMSTLDAHLVSLDVKTGNVIWDADVGDEGTGHSKTAAPLIVGDKVVTGIAGGEYGIRGYLDAYDAQTGERTWRFYTIPGPDHPDNRSWSGDSWRTGGSPTWVTGSYDPDLNLVYWGTGNPGPDWNGDVRLGDNLYSDSVLALDGDTGEMQWYFQFTPHDIHDWDATQIPILADAEFGGRERKLMLFPNRNAFFYVLDREDGEFLLGTPYAKQTWAERLDENGRPVRAPNTAPSVEGTLVAPAVVGGSNWWSPSYSPRTGLLYVMAYDAEAEYFIREDEYVPGEHFVGGGGQQLEPETYVSAVRAIEPQTGERKWEYQVQPQSTSGLLSTAGDLVFGGTVNGFFFALDAHTGEELWYVSLGSKVHAGPMSYAVDGQQYITIAAGNVIFTFTLKDDPVNRQALGVGR